MENQDQNQVQHQSIFKSKVAKGIYVAIFSLAMAIPLFFVQNLVNERQNRKNTVVSEVTEQWSRNQQINSLFIQIPFEENVKKTVVSNGKNTETIERVLSNLYVSPKSMNVDIKIKPEIRKKGIYEIVVYESFSQIKGSFDALKLPETNTRNYKLNEARILFGVNDIRGLQKEIVIKMDGKNLALENSDLEGYVYKNLGEIDLVSKDIPYEFELDMRGSTTLNFIPTAANTTIKINSNWKSPGFYGAFLPKHEISKTGFEATWNVLELNRNLPRYATNLEPNKWQDYSFGVNLVETANNYQKNERASKYGLLIIGLTFFAFFFVEMLILRRVNLIQYGLIGIALVIFYCLLLSISEILIFNAAYLISAVATILLISLFAKSIFDSTKAAGGLALLITVLYSFIFTIIQLEDTALLIGSLGLFIILGITMYISRKVKWD